jgi:predicted transcriptional regulator
VSKRRDLILPKPTEAELGILNVLWERGQATVREVHEALYGDEGAGYTTALKLLQVMHAKGWWSATIRSAPTCIAPSPASRARRAASCPTS